MSSYVDAPFNNYTKNSVVMTLQKVLNALFIFVLCFVLLSAYFYQFSQQEDPCPLCLLQRLGMIGIIVALLMNLRFGIKVEHYGLAILSALVGRLVSLRQIGLHVCLQFPTFGVPVFGYDLYVWALIVFTCSTFACAVLLILYGYAGHQEYLPSWNHFEESTFTFAGLVIFANIVTTFLECGLGPCDG